MPRFDRSLVVPALIGLVATCFGLGAAANEMGGRNAQKIPRYRAETVAQAQTAMTAKDTRSDIEQYPCTDMVGANESALCAQWLSTRASEASAYWAKWSFWVGLAGLIGLLVSLAFTRIALGAAREASAESKRALSIAERNADAAARQTEISEDTAKRTLRAYLHMKHVRVSNLIEQEFRVGFRAINYGETPAHRITHYHAMDILEWCDEPELSLPVKADLSGDAPVAKGQSYDGFMEPWADALGDTAAARIDLLQMLQSGSLTMHLSGWIDYEDVFGRPHRTDYHVCLGGPGGAELREIEGEVGLCLDPWFWRTGNGAS